MLFSSITFLCFFLPAVILVYFIVPKRSRNFVLLFFSLVFYFCGEPKFLMVMLGSTLSVYLFGLWIDRSKNKKLALILSLAVSIGILLYFKYTDFFITNINSLFSSNIEILKIVLPIGISFYTFQQISYTVDLYRGEVAVQRNLLDFATYVCLFPQLIAGPIVRYSAINNQLKSRSVTLNTFSDGAFRFTIGLGKKVLIANVLGELTEKCLNLGQQTTLSYWLYAVAFALQIYFDFSGYSDMAIGLGKLFGFEFPENFNYPFISKSATEFWRRWHMSLGSWFRDYVYIPLGGNRVSPLKWIRNILIVWFLTGFWHGASWNFIIWGLYFALILVLEKLFIAKLLAKIPKIFSHLYLVLIVIISFVIFASENLTVFSQNIVGMFSVSNLINKETLYLLESYGVLLAIAILGATPLLKNLTIKLRKGGIGVQSVEVLKPIYMALLLVLSLAFLINGSFNPFLYFRF